MIHDRTTNGILMLGRVLLAASFAPYASAHVSNISGLAFSMAQKGMPYSDAVAALVVLAEIFGPLALLLGAAPRFAPAVLIVATIITTGALHRFWEFNGAARQLEQAIFTSQLGVLAGLFFASVAGSGSWALPVWWRGIGAAAKPAPKKKAPRPRPAKPKAVKPREVEEDDELADAA
jgi:putative oxidoreductase